MSMAGLIAADFKLLDKMTQYKFVEEGSEDHKAREARVHQRSADRILQMALSLGGLWVKLAQYVSTLKPMVPAAYTDTLATAQDDATGQDFAIIAKALERELGGPPEAFFAYFERKPVASASIAQVHRAITLDGERVAVKVQYPSLPGRIRADLAAVRAISWFWARFYPAYDMRWMLPEFEETLLNELDFRQEAVTAERAGRMFTGAATASPDRVHVPGIRWDLTTERVMTMEWIDGVKPTRLERLEPLGVTPLEVANVACGVFGDMTFLHGIVHIDPHPGNLMVRRAPDEGLRHRAKGLGLWPDAGPGVGRDDALPRPKTDAASAASGPWQLVVLDHGMYRRLAPDFRQGYASLWEALILRDEALGRRACAQLGMPADSYDAFSLMLTYRMGSRSSQKKLRETVRKFENTSEEEATEFLKNMPRDFFFVSRNTSLVRGLNLALGGTSASRIALSGDAAVRGMALSHDVVGARQLLTLADAAAGRDVTRPSWWWPLLRDLGIAGGHGPDAAPSPVNPFGRLNEPTDSELSSWLHTPSGRAAVEAAGRVARDMDAAVAQAAIEADWQRQATPESNMSGLTGSLETIFGASAATAGGFSMPCRKGGAAPAPPADLVARAAEAVETARTRSAEAGTWAEVQRHWTAWWAVVRARLTVRALDMAMWVALAVRSLLSGSGLAVEENWGEITDAGREERRRRRRERRKAKKEGRPYVDPDDEEAQAEEAERREAEAAWAVTARDGASEEEKRMHAESMATIQRESMG